MKGMSNMYDFYGHYSYPYYGNIPMFPYYPEQFANPYYPCPDKREYAGHIELKDYGPSPLVININAAAKQNNNYRTALWTGKHLQLTLMSLDVGEDIGLEMHPDVDQFIRIEKGQGMVMMGDTKEKLDFQKKVYDGYVFIIPAGKWHNLINTGCTPLKLYSIYAPPEHPYGTVHRTKKDAQHLEKSYS